MRRPKEKFHELDPETLKSMSAVNLPNDLHVQLIHLCEKLDHLAEAWINDNLDPSCVKIFVRT